MDTTHALALPGVSAPQGTPGYGTHFKFKQVYDTARARGVLGLHFRDRATTARETIEDLKARGW